MGRVMKKPVWFTDWKKIYHREAKYLGHDALHLFDGHQIKIDRVFWKRLHRLKRLKVRMDLESKVKDRTWRKSLLDIIFTKEDDS